MLFRSMVPSTSTPADPSLSKAPENSRKDLKGNDKTRRRERSNSPDILWNLNQAPAGRDKQRKREKAAPAESEKPTGRGRQQEKSNNNNQTQPSKELPYKDVPVKRNLTL